MPMNPIASMTGSRLAQPPGASHSGCAVVNELLAGLSTPHPPPARGCAGHPGRRLGATRVLLGAIAVALAGCGPQPGEAPPSARPPAQLPAAASSTNPVLASDADTRLYGFHAFSVEVTLSPAATARMSQGGETIIVWADYFGWPLPAAEPQADQAGQLDLGRAQRELPAAGDTRFDDTGFRAERVPLLKGEPQVNINVFSGRKTADDNVLACDIFQGTLRAAAAAPIVLHCSLIEENATTDNVAPPNAGDE